MRGRGGVIGLVAVIVAVVLSGPTARPDAAIEVQVAAAVEVAPTIDLALNTPRPASSLDVPTTAPTTAPTTKVPAPTTLPSTVAVAPMVSLAIAPVSTSTTEPRSIEEQALDLIRYDWRSRFPNLQIDFLGPRNGLRALTYPAQHRIEVFVRDTDTPASLHRVLAHELGHVVDVELNTPGERDRWLEQRGLAASTTWWPSEAAPDFSTGAGDFAEAFAVWETGVQSQSTLAGQPDADDLALVAELSS